MLKPNSSTHRRTSTPCTTGGAVEKVATKMIIPTRATTLIVMWRDEDYKKSYIGPWNFSTSVVITHVGRSGGRQEEGHGPFLQAKVEANVQFRHWKKKC
jgi:hypothetical protein